MAALLPIQLDSSLFLAMGDVRAANTDCHALALGEPLCPPACDKAVQQER